MKKLKLKHIVGIIGIALAVIGWVISSADHFPIVLKVLAPHYSNAIAAFRHLHKKERVLTADDVGFPEIAALLKEDLIGNAEPDITQFKTLNWGQAMVNTPDGMQFQKYLELEIPFSKAQPVTGKIKKLDERIEDRYLNRNFFAWSTAIFWIGIFVALVAVFL